MKIQNPVKNTIIRKIENTHAIWFGESKSFVILEEPAFTVFLMVAECCAPEEIIKTCTEKYGHLEENIPQFVHETIQKINYFNHPGNYDPISIRLPEEAKKRFVFPLRETYRIGNKVISIHYQNKNLRFALHPVFEHLTIKGKPKNKHQFEIVENKGILYFSYNGKCFEAFKEEDINYFTGSVKQQLYSIVYNREYYDWMMILHASGIISNKQSVLFSAAAGKGKSTIAALLKAKGYGYLSDDFIAADENGFVYPFPAAISVKDGAFQKLSSFYPELREKESEIAFTGKKVRYIPVHNNAEIDAAPFPVRALVFVQYNETASFHFEEVNKKEALQLLLKETWVNPVPQMINCFFDWIEKTTFYSLRYSQTDQAMEAVQKLFSI
ncbi:MAG: hypothetical protein L3J11_05225 [Draconibacterium sp.]|nr:hypothetical protein [Draconibacterium sp.]